MHRKTFMKENSDSVFSQMKKGVLEMMVLALLNAKEDYPAGLIERMEKSGMPMVEGTIYPLLARLKNAGYLSYRWEESNAGPPRKYFKITPEGKKYLNELSHAWNELQTITQHILKK